MLLAGILEHSLVRPVPGRMEMLHSKFQKDSVGLLKADLQVYYDSSMNHSQVRSPGFCLWRFWELSLSLGSGVRA
jgi:hypothetical protein